MSTLTIVLLVILIILIGALIALYFFGKKAQKKQEEQQAQIEEKTSHERIRSSADGDRSGSEAYASFQTSDR